MKRLLLGALLVLTACGGGSDETATDNSSPAEAIDDQPPEAGTTAIDPDLDAEIAAATETAVQLLALSDGDAIAPSVALLVAIDRGYAIDDISTAITERRLLLDGIITDNAGTHVRPTGADTGIITDKSPIQGLRSQANQPVTTSGLAEQLLLDLQMVDLTNIPPGPPDAPRLWERLGGPDARHHYFMERLANLLFAQQRPIDEVINTIIFGEVDLCIDQFDREVGFCDDRNLPDRNLSEPIESAPADDDLATDAPPADDDGTFATGSYLGMFVAGALVEEEGATILDNTVALDVSSDSIIGDINFLAEGEFADHGACVTVFAPVEDGDLVLVGIDTFAGSIGVDIGLDLEKGCAGGPPATETFSDQLTITITGSMLTGTLLFDGEPVTFTAALVE